MFNNQFIFFSLVVQTGESGHQNPHHLHLHHQSEEVVVSEGQEAGRKHHLRVAKQEAGHHSEDQ